MNKPRVLIVNAYVYAVGGGNAVAAWAIQTLRHDYDVTLAALAPIDCEAVNRSFGTTLQPEDFTVSVAPAFWRAVARYSLTPGGLLQISVNARWARQLSRNGDFDLLVSLQNELDFGRTGVQYVHFPWVYMPRPAEETRWYHRIPGLLRAYRGACQKIAQASDEGLRRSVSLVNSRYVAGMMRDAHGVTSTVLYPPVPGGFPDVTWDDRVNGIVGVGRMNPLKRWDLAVDIVDRVRSQGIDLSLTLISHRDHPRFETRMEALAAARPWMRILYDLPRAQLVREVARHRYGLHAMRNEHFGIAPAELLRAGCVTFVHRSGGPMEIVGHREDLMFDDAGEACARICRAIRDEALSRELRRFAAERGRCYSEDRFCAELREHLKPQVRARAAAASAE